MTTIDPDEQCPEHGGARWRCDADHGDPTALFDDRDPAQREAASNVARMVSGYLTGAPTYAVDDEFGNEITRGLDSYDAAVQQARAYLSAHDDAPCVRVYEDTTGGESWDLKRAEALT